MQCKWQVEINEYASRVLAKHWPNVRRHDDVKTFPPNDTEDWHVDVIAGGFPCQDISSANTSGSRMGLSGDKSGLWLEFSRLVGLLLPPWVVVENSANWESWMPAVRRELRGIGYLSVPLILCAGSFGAPHPRPRGIVVANSYGDRESLLSIYEKVAEIRPIPRRSREAIDAGTLGVGHGVPYRTHRLRVLGNAVHPAVSEWLGRLILESHMKNVAQRNQS